MKKRNKFLCGLLLLSTPLCMFAQDSDEMDDTYTLSPFEISTSGGINDYLASESITGTRVATSIDDLPFAVNVVTVEFINDFVAEDLADQFAYVSAFAPDGSQEGAYQLRGFRQTNQLRNGFTRLGLVSRTNMDRAEVIKGPNAAIYGRTDPGGIINIITKRPSEAAAQKVDLAWGTNGYLRGQLSSTGPLTSSKNLLYRFDTSYLEMDHGYGFAGRKEQTYSGVLEYRYGAGNRIVFETEYLKRDQSRGRRLPFYQEDNKSKDGPDRYLSIATDLFDMSFVGPNEYNNRDVQTTNLTWEHQISDRMSLRVSGNTFDRTYNQWTTFPSRVVSQGTETSRIGKMPFLEPVYKDIHETGEAFQADLLTQFETGDIQHKLLFTVDYQHEDKKDLDYRYNRKLTSNQRTIVENRTGTTLKSGDLRKSSDLNVQFFDISNPDYSALDEDHIAVVTDVTSFGSAIGGGTIGSGRLNRDNFDDIEVFGLFMSERMEMMDGRLLMFGNVRYDEVSSTLEASSVSTSNKYKRSETDFSVDGITYALGVNYEVMEKVKLYANYATSFQKQTEFNDTDRLTGDQLAEPEFFDNEEGSGWEIGMKTTINERIFSTLTYFSIQKENIIVPDSRFIDDVENPGEVREINFKSASGSEESRGAEIDLNWLITDSLQITGAYGYVDSEIVKADKAVLFGLPSAQTPKHNFGMMARYRVRDGKAKGLEMGMGYRHSSESRPTNDSGRELFYQDGYSLVEGFIGYRFDTGDVSNRIQLTVKNMTDEKYTVGYLNRGEPRRMIIKWTSSF